MFIDPRTGKRFTLEGWSQPLKCVVKVDNKIREIVCPVEHIKNCTNILDSLPSVAELQEKGFVFHHTRDFPMCLDLSKLIVFRPLSEVYLACVIKLHEGN